MNVKKHQQERRNFLAFCTSMWEEKWDRGGHPPDVPAISTNQEPKVLGKLLRRTHKGQKSHTAPRTNAKPSQSTHDPFRRTYKRQKPRFTPSDERTYAKNHASLLQANVQTPKTMDKFFRRTCQRQKPRFTPSDERTNARNHTSVPQTNVGEQASCFWLLGVAEGRV